MLEKLKRGSSLLFFLTILLFLAAASLRVLLADYDKLISVYPDELLYIEACRNFLSGGGFTFRGVDSGFDKVLYSVFLLPSMAFDETDTQLKVVSLLNAIYISSAVFPTILLAKRTGLGTWTSLMCAVFVLLLPDMCLSMTFMSENIYFPFSLWLVYWIWVVLSGKREKQLRYSALLAVACFLIYLCKEVGLCFVLVYGILLISRIVKEPEKRKSDVKSLIVFALVFAGLFFCFKTFIFHQGSHYMVLPLQSLVESVGFFVNSLVVNLEYMVVSIFVIPLIVCVWAYGGMAEKDRSLFWISILWGLITVLVITYTISVREDVDLNAVRQHTRYYSALVVPFFILFIKYAGKKFPDFENSRNFQFAAVAIAVFFILGTVFLSQVYYGSLVDNFNLRYLNWAIDKIRQYTVFDAVLAMRVIAAAAVLLFTACIVFTRFRRFAIGVFLSCVLVICLIGNAVCINLFEETYSISEQEKSEVLGLGNYLSDKHANVLIVLDSNPTYSLCNKKLDTFLNVDKEYQIYADTLFDLAKDDEAIDLTKESVATKSFNLMKVVPYEDIDAIDYLLVNVNQGINIASNSGTLVGEFTYGDYRLYDLNNTKKVNVVFSLPESDYSMRIG